MNNLSDYLLYVPGQSVYDILTNNLSFFKSLETLPSQTCIPIKGKMLDELAYKYYGDEGLWWVIYYYNKIVDPFTCDGKDIVYIPNKAAVNTLLVSQMDIVKEITKVRIAQER